MKIRAAGFNGIAATTPVAGAQMTYVKSNGGEPSEGTLRN